VDAIIYISLKYNLFSPWYNLQIASFGVKQLLLTYSSATWFENRPQA